MNQAQQYYTEQSAMTDPGPHAALYADLPRDLPSLCEVVQGLLIHVIRGNRYNVTLPGERMVQVKTRRVTTMLETIMADDPRPIAQPRPPVERFVGTCRHYAVLFCSMLRHQHVPARARNGFSAYLKRGQYSDHWVCEYWNAEQARWIMLDAQMDAVHRVALKIEFDHLDVPHEEQIHAGEMWRRCRQGQVDPNTCGSLQLWGMDYVKADLLRDLISLNKIEMLPWDGAALTETPYAILSDAELALLDRVADVTTPAVKFEEVRDLYETHSELHAKHLPNPHGMV